MNVWWIWTKCGPTSSSVFSSSIKLGDFLFITSQISNHVGHGLFTIQIDMVLLPSNNQRIDRTWNDVRCPKTWREISLRQTVQLRVTSDTQKIQSSDWPKWRFTLWRNGNSRIVVVHRTTIQAVHVCRYVNFRSILWFIQPHRHWEKRQQSGQKYAINMSPVITAANRSL